MKRGDLYLLRRPGAGDPKKQRVMIVVSRQTLVDSRFPTVVCAPVFTMPLPLRYRPASSVSASLSPVAAARSSHSAALP